MYVWGKHSVSLSSVHLRFQVSAGDLGRYPPQIMGDYQICNRAVANKIYITKCVIFVWYIISVESWV